MRLKFLAAAWRQPAATKQLALADESSSIGELLAEWPETVGVLVWPYQCAAWDAETRVKRIAQHFDAVRAIKGLRLAPDEKLILADLSSFSPGTSLTIDRAAWLSREGHLTLSLFKDHFRAFTLSFSLSGFPGLELFIGGLQGRHGEDMLTIYRDLTRDFEGMRPRDFMLEMLRMFAARVGVRRIYAVTDEFQIFKHEYFGGHDVPGLNYDNVWEDRGGERTAPTHFELPLGAARRAIEDVPAKKRSMYRRRYEMLDKIEAMIPNDLSIAERRHFDAQ